MPEYPDLELYLHALRPRLRGRRMERIRVLGPALLRTVEPRAAELEGRRVEDLFRMGKRIVIELEGAYFLAVHLMIAGRFQWKPRGAPLARRGGQASFDFEHGSLHLTEAGSRKRASLHVLRGEEALRALDAGGLEPLDCAPREFVARMREANHTLKRALSDPKILAGVGNAYSDEILHRAGLSPFLTTHRLDEEGLVRLLAATREVLGEWRERLISECGEDFPTRVTAFRPEMAVHGRFGRPCPVCGAPVQRVVYASKNEMNYCPGCQTGGRILADRSLSRLLREDWPRTLEELEDSG